VAFEATAHLRSLVAAEDIDELKLRRTEASQSNFLVLGGLN
jgi:hypothetical protein